jgi:ketosteroid isomerase-like protein
VTTSPRATPPAEDHRALLDLLARYCESVDRYDLDGVAATFTADAVTDYGPGRGGEVVGREAIRARIALGQAEFQRTHHQLGQVLLVVRSVGRVAGITYVTASHERWNGDQATACLRYLDEFASDSQGEWRIASRRVEAAIVVGFQDVTWTWVDRALPAGSPAPS